MAAPRRVAHRALAACAVAATLAVIAAQAQSPTSNVFRGFAQDRNKPLEIEGEPTQLQLNGFREVYGAFNRQVRVRLGDTTITSRFLTVHYDSAGLPGDLEPADPGKRGRVRIYKLEPSYDVTITHQGQTAKADNATFDMRANQATLDGNVMMTEGTDVLRGGRLTADLVTGAKRIESTAGSHARWRHDERPPIAPR